MERVFEIKVSDNVEFKFQETSKKLAPDPLNVDRLFHQTPDLPESNDFK